MGLIVFTININLLFVAHYLFNDLPLVCCFIPICICCNNQTQVIRIKKAL